jgi:hypothetical protein
LREDGAEAAPAFFYSNMIGNRRGSQTLPLALTATAPTADPGTPGAHVAVRAATPLLALELGALGGDGTPAPPGVM